MEEVDFCS